MRILITGITGSLGTAVTKELLQSLPKVQVFGYSRDELRQKQFMKDPRVTLILGDVRDKERMLESARKMDLIFHFAALKHVDLLEDNPEESIETNIRGTQNILHAQRIHKIPRVVLSSTDKAALPINVYGSSKALAEKLVLRNKNNVVTRYGNVLASNGSVVPTFVQSLERGNKIEITDADMSRFWIRLEDASRFVIKSAVEIPGGLKIPDMKAAKTIEVGLAIAEILGKKNPTIVHVGRRPGEKLSECLRTEYEGDELFSHTAEQFSKAELIDLLTPIVKGLR